MDQAWEALCGISIESADVKTAFLNFDGSFFKKRKKKKKQNN